MLNSISEIKNAARNGVSKYYFDRDTLEFFNSRIGQQAYPTPGGAYFITSEQQDEDKPRLYTVRYCSDEGSIGTVGEFQQFETSESANIWAKNCANLVTNGGADPLTVLGD